MTIRHLQIFKEVCAAGSITHAAEKLNMTQPAVSIAVRELESYYHTRLFDRIGRRICLTEAGSVLLRYAENLLDQFDEAEKVLRDGDSFVSCTIDVNVTVGETMLEPVLRTLERELPQLTLKVFVDNTQTIERRLSAGEIDFAIVDGLPDDTNRVVLPLHAADMAIVCAPGFNAAEQISVEELSELRLMLREKGSGSRLCTDTVFREHDCVVHPSVESSSDLCLLKLARAGFGVTIMPRELVADDLSTGRLRELTLTDGRFRRRYFIVYNRRKYLTESIRRAIAEIRGSSMGGEI
ncbi:MAG: LysR family transcriptional regulator [Clostridia bacterium]|nr:LysR family transcriptional regulator [Clostridia bacterium]